MSESSDDGPNDLRIAIMRLARRMRLERAADDVTDGQLSVLFVIAQRGPQTLSELSEQERVSPPSMHRTVNALEAAGLVTRESSAEDGRKVIVTPTDAATALVAETRRRRVEWFSHQVEVLSDEERSVLAAAVPILQKLVDS